MSRVLAALTIGLGTGWTLGDAGVSGLVIIGLLMIIHVWAVLVDHVIEADRGRWP